ncbi:DUF342 domain-containing protein [Aquibacillus halophilus]|uniref:DUF342 domain-containing protein n=1 Tax=Aquibacillus halophilus TaxID=930132 RepID=A0A6A8D946_9BACI|nr:FapA family protein [Aquibacillus halophilus]MRH42285.1 DUF342 domain-containing protein [Aquibacillus halophilus]
MEQFDNWFDLIISKDLMTVSINCKEDCPIDFDCSKEDLIRYLVSKKIKYGIIDEELTRLLDANKTLQDSITIVKGKPPEKGMDGFIHYIGEQSIRIEQEKKKSFRDVTKIPSVKEGEKLAYITNATAGEKGINILGEIVDPIPGKPLKIRAGKNVRFDEQENTFFATANGQLSFGEKVIHVHPLFEIKGDLSLKTGNLDFVGSVTIYGNVPTGYSVKAEGDVRIFGLVEAAYIKAGGSVQISEGIAGLKKGTVQAGLDIKIGYINQAKIEAGRDIIVENSILHSDCVAQNNIRCQNGNIIGGILSAGKIIEAKDIGNKMNTKTDLAFGINTKLKEQEKELHTRKKDLITNKMKLEIIGNSLTDKEKLGLSSKEKILLLKQRHSMEKTSLQLEEVTQELDLLEVQIGDLEGMKLIVKGRLYSNVYISFGKYLRKITKTRQYVSATLNSREITIQSL